MSKSIGKCNCGNEIIFKKHYKCSICEMKDRRQSQEQKFEGLIEDVDFVRCRCEFEGSVCNWPDVMLTKHLQIIHGYDKHKYYELYPDAKIICDSVKKSFVVTGPRSQKARENMSRAHMGIEPWNKGQTKDNNESLKSASEKMIEWHKEK
jgi:hypothetical protein